jgi:class 3 adenylate cyclase
MSKLSGWLSRARAAERSGNLIIAYDLAAQGLKEHSDSIDLAYLATRVLARMGSTEHAASIYKKFQLDRERNLDFVMLKARLAKDRALHASAHRGAALRAAATNYGRIYARTHDGYPAVNAATLYLLAGDHKRAEFYARQALNSATGAVRSSIDRYYQLVTRAEAALICGQTQTAQEALQRAARYLGCDFDAAATTRKQLRLVCRATSTNPDVLEVIRPPAVLHYSGPTLLYNRRGHMLDSQRQRACIEKIADYLLRHNIGYAYGSLTAGAEILCAEACLQAHVDLHVVLPFNENEFIDTMVRSGGPIWVRRWKKCISCAKSVTFATTDAYQGDDGLFTYACRLAMGLAILRARHLDAKLSHLKLQIKGWNFDPAGYAANLQKWQQQGHPAVSLALTKPGRTRDRNRKRATRKTRLPPRSTRALIFGDVAGFSRIPDHLIPLFQKRFMGTIAAVLHRYARHVVYRNSWGDAVYIVMDDAVIAAECCLVIQQAISRVNFSRRGLPSNLTLRLAAHFGPVYNDRDPIRDEPSFYGVHTTFAARMEPVTPPGTVYVTEALAAAIAIEKAHRLHLEYVGNVPLAKNFGYTRMYSISPVKGNGHG